MSNSGSDVCTVAAKLLLDYPMLDESVVYDELLTASSLLDAEREIRRLASCSGSPTALNLHNSGPLDSTTRTTPNPWSDSCFAGEARPLAVSSAEYFDVEDLINRSREGAVAIVNIYSISNEAVLESFECRKVEVATDMGTGGVPVERSLFHGIDPGDITRVINGGLRSSFAGVASSLGHGLEFVASFSDMQWSGAPDESDHRYALFCRVLTGEYCRGRPELRVPPRYPSKSTYYHSVADTDIGSRCATRFMVFADDRVYPGFLIEYRLL